MFADQVLSFRRVSAILLLSVLFGGCAHDAYEQQVEMIKRHSEAFYQNLSADRVAAAIHDNEEIEAVASRAADVIRNRRYPTADNRVDREWMVRKTALETGAENWLALARYLTLQKRYDQARAVYQRILDSYGADAERPYRERAARAKQDLDILSPPASTRQ